MDEHLSSDIVGLLRREPADVAKQHFAADRDLARLIELKGAVAPLDGLASSLA